MRKLRIERMENRELLAADGVGAAVDFVETDTATTIQVTLPGDKMIVREVGKKIVADPGGGSGGGNGAEVEVIERDSTTLLQVSLPTDDVLIREVKKKNVAPGGGDPNDNTPTVTGEVARDGSVTLANGTTIETTNGEALLQAGQIEAGDAGEIVAPNRAPGTEPITSGSIKVKTMK